MADPEDRTSRQHNGIAQGSWSSHALHVISTPIGNSRHGRGSWRVSLV
jgi:hypothetical protein